MFKIFIYLFLWSIASTFHVEHCVMVTAPYKKMKNEEKTCLLNGVAECIASSTPDLRTGRKYRLRVI